MLWNVFVITSEGDCIKFNTEPYDSDEVGYALELVSAEAITVIVVPEVLTSPGVLAA